MPERATLISIAKGSMSISPGRQVGKRVALTRKFCHFDWLLLHVL